jgi:nucleoside-diphosphate-sugar epimerase
MENLQQIAETLSGKRILVTGGTGFIGGRLIERLASECHDVRIRVLVRNFARACRIARFPLEFIRGDVAEAVPMAKAVQGCDIIFHCAYGNTGPAERQRIVNFQGTRNLLEAAAAQSVATFVHLSTILVYGETPDGDIDESRPRRYLGAPYADSKLDAENLVLSYAEARRVAATVLQPAEVYGPYGTVWTQNVLRALQSTPQILINDGAGFCSPVYVDDLVSAMMLAAVKPQAVGEAFLIGAARPATWKDFYGRFEKMLGYSGTLSMTANEALAYYKSSLRGAKSSSLVTEGMRLLLREPLVRSRLLQTREALVLRGMARRLVPMRVRASLRARITSRPAPVPPPLSRHSRAAEPLDPLAIRLNQSKTVFRIDKAQRLLGYAPQFSLEAGMRLTRRWAEWSNLLGQTHGASS